MAVNDRVERLRAYMTEHDLGAFLVKNCSDVMWLTGVTGLEDHEDPHLAVVLADRAVLYTDSRYIEVAQRDTADTVWEPTLSLEKREEAVSDLVGDARTALENTTDVATWETYTKALKGELIVTDRVVEKLRAIKDESEIATIARAQAVTDAAFAHMLEYLRPGLTEREIEIELEFFMRKHGSEGIAFSSIVASGPNGSLPHAHPSDRAIGAGDFLTMDFGARVDGYCSDMTRTVMIGTASDRQREVYELVLKANEACHAACRAGMSGKDLHLVAADVISAAGYGDNFQHGLGHGVGIDVHELPNAGMRSTDTLEAGSIVTIEPGVYLPGEFGVRIEDMVVVREGGCDNLTGSRKDLIEL